MGCPECSLTKFSQLVSSGQGKKLRHSGPGSSFFNATMAAAAKKVVEESSGQPTHMPLELIAYLLKTELS